MATADWFVNREEPKNRRRSLLISVLIELIIIMLLFLPLLTYPDPPPGQEGILINFGLPDQGGGELAEESVDVPTEEVTPEEETPEEVKPVTPTKPTKTEKAKEKEVVTTDEPNPKPVKPKTEPKTEPKPEPEKEPEEPRKDAPPKQDAGKIVPNFNKNKNGTNPNNKPGEEGDPTGKPNQQTKINGQGTQGQGSGQVGGGLSNRSATARPVIKDTFNEEGRVVVSICVDAAGNVTEAKYTQFGSNVSSSKLISLAESNARNWKFGPGEDNQCGTITYTFKLN